jgi:hypothetical protein
MTTQDEDRDVMTSHCFEPFPEPQTIPSGWDLSGFNSIPEPFDPPQGGPAADTEEDGSL